MSTMYDEIARGVATLAATKTAAERRELSSSLISAIRALATERPAADDALALAYEAGALAVLELGHAVRREHEESFRAARYSAAVAVLNGLENYGQTLLGAIESRASSHLSERRRKKAGP